MSAPDTAEKGISRVRITSDAEYAINGFDTAARLVEGCECETMPCDHVAAYNKARKRLLDFYEVLEREKRRLDVLEEMRLGHRIDFAGASGIEIWVDAELWTEHSFREAADASLSTTPSEEK